MVKNPTDGMHADVSAAVERYNNLLDAVQTEGKFLEVITDFQRYKNNIHYNEEAALWSTAAWQLFLHRFIGDTYSSSPFYTRVISDHDVKYKLIVAELMGLCEIAHFFVNDSVVLSTTVLLNTIGWDSLIRSKVQRFDLLHQLSV